MTTRRDITRATVSAVLALAAVLALLTVCATPAHARTVPGAGPVASSHTRGTTSTAQRTSVRRVVIAPTSRTWRRG